MARAGVARPASLALASPTARPVCCDDDGMPNFDRIRYRRHDASVSRSRVRPHRAPVQAEAGSVRSHEGLGADNRDGLED
jgi:hypothetical protein